MKSAKLWRGLTAVFAVILAVACFLSALCFKWSGQINVALGTVPPVASMTDDTAYYGGDYEITEAGYKQMVADSDASEIQTMQEGAVLVKNANNALPLASTERRVTLFGMASVVSADPKRNAGSVYRGNSGGPSSYERVITLKAALEKDGFAINETVYDALANGSAKRVKVPVENKDGIKSSIGEEPVSFYDPLASSYASDYNGAAIVVFSRDGGEGRDLFASDAEGISQLALHKNEADLLKMIKASGKFAKTVVLINSAYPMELGFVEDEQYGVDACLWIGGPGLLGFQGVADILSGKVDPSGHFVDTYAADSLSSAAVQNAFDISFSNGNYNYVVYAEGIYVGYKYYETRYHDQVLGINGATGKKGAFASKDGWNYAEETAYPFGHGLSYASFTQTLQSVEWDRSAHTVTAVVKVKNDDNERANGNGYSGKSKSAVQLYVSLPWERGQAEKSAIQLIDFGKTELLDKGEEATVTLTVDDYIFATYDENAQNGADASKKGCYVFDKGDYYFAIGADCHDALNNVLAAKDASGMTDAHGKPVTGNKDNAVKISLDAYDNTTYARSVNGDGEIVCNRFDDLDINSYYDSDVVTYMTRGDWNTFPQKYDGIEATAQMLAELNAGAHNKNSYVKPADAPAYNSFKQGEKVTLKLVQLRDVPFDDARWDTFIDQLTLTDLCNMVGENFGQPAVVPVGKQPNTNSDGPAGPQSSYRVNGKVIGNATVRVNEVVAASTFNKKLIAARGKFIAEDCLFGGTTQLWSPGCNIHRTPFSGRNFEYYSEDPVMSYICSAVQCAAMQEYGVNAAPKHFCANDQETNREGLSVFMSEQAFRQGPLKGFEGAFTKGGALGTMMSFSKLGTKLVYASEPLLTQVLRNEWGFEGVTITDSVANWGATNQTLLCLAAGTDTFNARTASGSEIKKYLTVNKDGYLLSALRQANKRFFYAMSRSNNINGLTVNTDVKEFIPWWQPTLIAIIVVLGVATAGCLTMFVLCRFVFVKKDKSEVKA